MSIGMGVMLQMFSERFESDISSVFGETISLISFEKEKGDDILNIDLTNGHRIQIKDSGQSCCESRYMTCDDDLKSYKGAKLVSITLEDGPDHPMGGEYDDVHETQFLRISTDLGTIVVCTHVEHNGYYGGFAVNAKLILPQSAVV